MNEARAGQVLNDIIESVGHIESECERLCLLINEVIKNKYWQLRYKSEEEWIDATFSSFEAYRHLYYLAQAYEDDPSAITEIGRKKAEILIPVKKNEGQVNNHWRSQAKKLNADGLQALVRVQYPSRQEPKTELKLIERKLDKLKSERDFHLRMIGKIDELIPKWELKLTQIKEKAS